MYRLPLYRAFLCNCRVMNSTWVLYNSSYTYKHKNEGEIINVNEHRVQGLQNSKSKHHGDPMIKIPRFLRKTKDREQIERYYLVKKLCLAKDFKKAISNMREWIGEAPVSKSTVLILNGLLYSLFEQGMSKNIVLLNEIMDARDIRGDRSTYIVLIDSFAKMKNFAIVVKLLEEMIKVDMVPHNRSFMAAAELALEEKHFVKAIEYFQKTDSVYKEMNDELCASFILNLVDGRQVGCIESILEDFREHKMRTGDETMAAIERYFHSELLKGKWMTNRTTISRSGVCQNCKEKLNEARFGVPEEVLSEYFKELLIRTMNKQESTFTGKNSFKELVKFLDDKGPFEVVVDGLNMAMHPLHGLNLESLLKLVEYFSSQGQKVLVMAANELIHPKRSKTVSSAEHQKAMTSLRDIATTYFVKHNQRGIDDLFLINAALYLCRGDFNVQFVSNDKFMDHRVCMKAETLNRFQRWLSHHQLMVHWYDRTRMKLVYEPRTNHAVAVQTTENSWHFPSTDEKTWMCAKRV